MVYYKVVGRIFIEGKLLTAPCGHYHADVRDAIDCFFDFEPLTDVCFVQYCGEDLFDHPALEDLKMLRGVEKIPQYSRSGRYWKTSETARDGHKI